MKCQVCDKNLFRGDYVYGVCSDCAKKAIYAYVRDSGIAKRCKHDSLLMKGKEV